MKPESVVPLIAEAPIKRLAPITTSRLLLGVSRPFAHSHELSVMAADRVVKAATDPDLKKKAKRRHAP